jgi:hypothetical protein
MGPQNGLGIQNGLGSKTWDDSEDDSEAASEKKAKQNVTPCITTYQYVSSPRPRAQLLD